MIDELLATVNKLPKKQKIESLKSVYESDLFLFSKYILNYPDLSWDTHGGICKALEADEPKKLIVVPRGCLKSTVASIAYPIWLLCKNPNLRILIDSELYKNARTFLREIRAQMQGNKQLIELWGKFESATNWTESEIIIRQRTKALKEASITCSGIDAEKTSQHYDVIIADDLNGPSNSNTEDGRQKVVDHYRLFTSLLEPGGTIVVIGTRYHQADLIGFILENELGKRSDGSDLKTQEAPRGLLQRKEIL